MHVMRPFLPIICLVLILPLPACGGGSGSGASSGASPSPPTTPIPQADPPGAIKVAYGSSPLQFGDLRLPPSTYTAPYPVAVIVHGGCWTAGVGTKVSSAGLADALAKRGIATWNIEYRAVGDAGGGYPGTFQDWSAATDYVRTLAGPHMLDLNRVIVVGHSAGGHAALWLAARSKIPVGNALASTLPLPLIAAVSLDGPGELQPNLGYSSLCGTAANSLLGGTPDAVPDRFAVASPSALLPLGVPQYLVSATFVPMTQAVRYRDMAAARGDTVTIVDQTASGHFEMITPGTPQEKQVEDLAVVLLNPR